MKRRVLILLILVVPLGILFPHLSDFPFPPLSNYSDLAISHYPNAVYLFQSLQTWRQIPLWSDAILSGYPFAADPLSGIWYLPGWLAYLFPLPLGFNLDILLHLLWGGIGVFFFLRKEKKSDYAALAGSILFELFSKTFAHYAAGHLTLLYAVAWTPWIFLCEKYFRKGRGAILSGIVLGMTALADVRWFAFLGIAWAAFAVYAWWLEPEPKTRKRTVLLLVRLVSQTILALLIAAPILVPLVELTHQTTRAGLTAADSLSLGLPPAYLANLVAPNLQAYAEWVIYPGGAAVVLALFGLSLAEFRRRNIFALLLAPIALLIALGGATPVGALLFQLPGFDWLRVPSRVVFLLGWAFAIIAADGIDFLLNLPPGERGSKAPGNGLGMVALSGFMVLICLGLGIYTGSVPVSYIWGTVIVSLAALFILLRRSRRMSGRLWYFSILALICLDLGGVDVLNIQFQPAEETLQQGAAVADHLKSGENSLWRAYSPSYSLPQQTAAVNGIELADGIDPLQLTAYVNFMEGATGLTNSGYSVTLPPFKTGSPQSDNQGSVPDSVKLGLLNVKYILSTYPLDAAGLKFQEKIDGTNIYKNLNFRPRAWVQADLDPTNLVYTAVSQIHWSPNEIEINASGEGWLVLSEIDYPGWNVAVDGQPAEITPYDGLLRAVKLGPGEHTVIFDFQPASVYTGIVLGILGWLAIGSFLLMRGKIW
jgi:hypothetical protein